MERFSAFVTDHRAPIVGVALVLALLSGIAALFVPINYDLTSYLPESAESTRALEEMDAEFDAAVPNARVMVNGVDVEQALAFKQQLADAPGIEGVLWLDDVVDLGTPLEMLDPAAVDQYYRDGHALFDVTVANGQETEALQAIYDIVGEDGNATGQAVNTAESKAMAGGEVANAFAILVPLILLILVLSTTSWIEPVFFLLAIGVSVLLNMGTNIFLGEVSYIAFTIAPILQLAVSLDYAIFLLHAFQRAREGEPDPVRAMRTAMRQSFSAIAASAATTLFGFAALGFMQFRIGADLSTRRSTAGSFPRSRVWGRCWRRCAFPCSRSCCCWWCRASWRRRTPRSPTAWDRPRAARPVWRATPRPSTMRSASPRPPWCWCRRAT